MTYRKGGVLGDSLLYIIYFLLMAMIFGGLYGGLVAFFGKGYDYRQSEADSLLKKTQECFYREKFFDLTVPLTKKVFLEKCGFSSDILDDGEHLIYVNNTKGMELSIGVADFKVRCFLNANAKNRDLPLCSEFKSGGNYLLIGSAQNSRRVSA